jgi:hypothetical protein
MSMAHADRRSLADVEVPTFISSFAGQWLLDAMPEIRQFSEKAVSILSPYFIEPLGEITRAYQRAALIASVLLLLLTTGAVSLGSAQEIGLKFNLNAKTVVPGLAFWITAYLWGSLMVRLVSDWNAWSINLRVASLDLKALDEAIKHWHPPSQSAEGIERRIRQRMNGSGEVSAETLQLQDEYAIAVFSGKYDWFKRRARAAIVARLFRLILDVLFPLFFGAYALCGAWKQAHDLIF